MALRVSTTLVAVGLFLAALITGFSQPRATSERVPLAISPTLDILDAPRADLETSIPTLAGPEGTPRFVVRATGYNSLASQTDSTPEITATGTRTRFGIVAVSRDLLSDALPYGSLVRLTDLGNFYNGRGAGSYQSLLDSQGYFIVEDTMHRRKRQQIDVWFGDYASAVNWGVRSVGVEVVRYGHEGPLLDEALASGGEFDGTPQLMAAR